jgi:hypothetical protein
MDQHLAQRAYTAVLKHFIETGHAPHYTTLAGTLDVTAEAARQAVRRAAELGVGCWMTPGTDYVGSFAPFHSAATQYAITVGGQQKWFAQCGLEAFAVRWMFPGQEVTIDARDLVTAEPIRLRFRDEKLVEASPDTVVGYINTPMWKWATIEDTAHL